MNNNHRDSASTSSPDKRSRALYLDGLRGLLSLAVFNSHITPMVILGYDRLSGHGLSSSPSAPPRSVLEIPLVASCVKRWEYFNIPVFKLLYSGSPAVAMFFGISGYVMSRSWIHHVEHPSPHPQRPDRTPMAKMSASAFRRPLRNILLSMASLIMPFLLCKPGYLDSTAVQRHGLTRVERPYRFALNNYDLLPTQHTTWWAQACDLLRNCARVFDIFSQRSDKTFNVPYNPVLWTVKLDLRASLLLLATQMALVEVKRPFRLLFLGVLATLGLSVGSLECPLFMAGWILAELHHLADQRGVQQNDNVAPLPQKASRRNDVSLPSDKTAILLLGCYLASYPTWAPSKASMFSPLRGANLPSRTWHSLGTVLTLYSLRDVPWARWFCETPFSQFLGRCSFSFYLTHTWVIFALGPGLFSRVWTVTGHEELLPFIVGFGVAYTTLLGSVLFASAVFRACVESPLSSFVDYLYRRASS